MALARLAAYAGPMTGTATGWTRALLSSCTAIALLAATSCASPPGGGALATTGFATPNSPEARAALALQLAAQARRDEDPRAMLVAARMMLASGTRPASMAQDGALTVEAGADPVASAWAREAIVFAAGDSALQDEAEAILAMRPRGVLRSSLGAGPLRYVRRVPANQTISFAIRTEPKLAARLAAIGDGDARIGLRVSTPQLTICDESASTTHTICAWQARTTQHSVTLRNAGPLDSDVMLLSN